LSSRLKHRVRLESVATATLNVGKSADGLAALQWWKEGKVDQIIEYCRQDVQVLRDLVRFGQEKGYVQYNDMQEQPVQVKVDW
jgi:DEAD/DEAH box helicase domain-containing protein